MTDVSFLAGQILVVDYGAAPLVSKVDKAPTFVDLAAMFSVDCENVCKPSMLLGICLKPVSSCHHQADTLRLDFQSKDFR